MSSTPVNMFGLLGIVQWLPGNNREGIPCEPRHEGKNPGRLQAEIMADIAKRLAKMPMDVRAACLFMAWKRVPVLVLRDPPPDNIIGVGFAAGDPDEIRQQAITETREFLDGARSCPQ